MGVSEVAEGHEGVVQLIAVQAQPKAEAQGEGLVVAGGAGSGSVCKLKVADQSLGMFRPLTSRAFTRQK